MFNTTWGSLMIEYCMNSEILMKSVCMIHPSLKYSFQSVTQQDKHSQDK